MEQKMPSIDGLVELLVQALRDSERREEFVDAFRAVASEISAEGPTWDVLSDLALDLGYFEPDPQRRNEAHQYYGEAKLEQTIRDALGELRALGVTEAGS